MFIVDNAPSHKSKLVQNAIKQLKLNLCYLSPYSP